MSNSTIDMSSFTNKDNEAEQNEFVFEWNKMDSEQKLGKILNTLSLYSYALAIKSDLTNDYLIDESKKTIFLNEKVLNEQSGISVFEMFEEVREKHDINCTEQEY